MSFSVNGHKLKVLIRNSSFKYEENRILTVSWIHSCSQVREVLEFWKWQNC